MEKDIRNDKPASTQFQLRQVFGSNEGCQVQEQDIISCLKYDPTGKFLCLGDHAGRIIIFQDKQQSKNDQSLEEGGQNECYDYFAQFQSHVRQLDPLNGIECSQKITDISWLKPQGKYLKLLTSNCKLIKCWRAFEKTDKKVVKSANRQLSLPKLQSEDPVFTAQQHHVFPALHRAEINSISQSNNEQYLLSTDQEQSFLWDLGKPQKPYIINSIAGRKKTATNELAITCSKMHPKSDSLFVYGMNRCELGLCDIRLSSNNGKVMDFGVQNKSMKNFFTDMVATVGSAEFMQNNKYIVSRQYLSIKIWDIANTRKPVHSICVQESLKSKLVNLFESDCIFDKFQVSTSADSSTIVTGNYNSNFHLLNCADGTNTQYELNFKNLTLTRDMVVGKCPPMSKLQTKKKSSVVSFHPQRKQVAVALMNCFFIYSV